jgi:glycosyltransferase involved in cell wall biosynthesis
VTVHALLPADVDTVPSGGNVYDRRVLAGLDVVEHQLPGPWPDGDPGTVAQALQTVPDGGSVLADGLVACGVPDALVPHADRLRLAVLVHLPLADERGLSPAVARDRDARERRALTLAAAVVTTSRWSADRIVARHGLDREKIHVAPPGVDAAPTAPGSAVTGTPPRILCLGALTPTKGQDVLVDALARVADRPWTAVLAGPTSRDPGYAVRIRARTAALGLADRITVPGPLTGHRLTTTWAATDLLVLPSRTESFGMVVSEALARGIPVVASDVGGVREAAGYAGGAAGTWVPAENVPALAAALRRWLEDPLLRSGWRLSALVSRGRLRPWSSTSETVLAALRAPGPPA